MTDADHDSDQEVTAMAQALQAAREQPQPQPPSIADAAAAAGLLDVAYATVDSPLGTLLLAATPLGLARLAYLDYADEAEVLSEMAARLSPRLLAAPRRLDEPRRELDEYFAGTRRRFEVPLDMTLMTDFTRRVLTATAEIPFGAVSTYRDVAARAGSPRGYRAAGNALGANPLPIVVPCHRVLHSGGGLGGYTGGLDRKRTLLEIEHVQVPPGRP
jgi:methylated-DNA-[protein]-cysteine S-methyltransferase